MYHSFYPTLFDRKYFENTVKVNDQFEVNNEFITQVLIDIFFFEKLQMMFIAMKLTSPFLISISVIGGIAIKVSMFFIINHIAMICTGGSFLVFLIVNGYLLINSIVRVYEVNYANNTKKKLQQDIENLRSSNDDVYSSGYSSAESLSSEEEPKEFLPLRKIKKFPPYNPLELDPFLPSTLCTQTVDDSEIQERNKQILEEFKTYVPKTLNDPEEIVNVVELNKKQKKSTVYDPLKIDPVKPSLEFKLNHPIQYKCKPIVVEQQYDYNHTAKCNCTKPCRCN